MSGGSSAPYAGDGDGDYDGEPITMSGGAAVPPARPPVPGHDDGLHDAVALIKACAREDARAVTVLGRCADDAALIAALVQIVGSGWCPACIANGEFREWALAAAEGSP